MAAAFARVAPDRKHLRLLLVGPDEGGVSDEVRRLAGAAGDRLQLLAYTDRPERYLAAADIMPCSNTAVLPGVHVQLRIARDHREGARGQG